MFPFQRSCEFSFQISDDHCDYHPEIIKLDVSESDFSLDIHDHPVNDDDNNINNNNNSIGRKRQRNLSKGGRRQRCRSSADGTATAVVDRNCLKKMAIHREIERQRRQQMASLYSSLQSLLPPIQPQRKRSTNDHIMEAANYINDLKRNIKQLKNKRDKYLKASSMKEKVDLEKPAGKDPSSLSGSSNVNDVIVTIDRFSDLGIEIKISTSTALSYRESEAADGFPLSTVLAILLEQGLHVFSCVSTRIKRSLDVHVIHSEFDGVLSTDLFQLQERLLHEIRSVKNHP